MVKRVLVLTLSFLLVASLGAFGAKKSSKPVDEKMAQRLERIENANYADEIVVSSYLTTPDPNIFFPSLPQNAAGNTYYDYQHNDNQRRQIAKGSDGTRHFTWMNMVGPEMTNNRYMDYNSCCTWLVAGGMHVTPAISRGGYGGLDLLPDDREVLCYHRWEPVPGLWATTISVEQTSPGLGEFDAYDIPDSVEGSPAPGTWPTMAISKQTRVDTVFMHITHSERQTSGAVDKDVGYVRCFEKPGETGTLVCQSPGWGSDLEIPANTKLAPNKVPYRVATTRLGGITVATSPVSEKVAIVYYQNYANTQTQNELIYIESTNNGDDWMTAGSMTPIQLTNYQAEDLDRAYDDLAVIYDYNDTLHIMWTTMKVTDANDVSLWHWDIGSGIRKAGFASASSDCDAGAWNLLIAKFTLGVYPDEPYDYLYFNYTKFQDGDISAGEFANGDLHVKASSNGGKTWGPEMNLTNTNTNGCVAPACSSEHWSSLAEIVDDSLHIQYILDLDAGGVAQEEGTFTNNPVVYMTYPRPLVPAVASIAYSPTQMISPVRWATNGGTMQDTIEFDNVGTSVLYVQMSGPGYVTINPSSFSIAEAGPTQIVDLTFNAGAFADTFLVDSLKILSNHDSSGVVYIDTAYVPVHVVVSDSFYYAEFDTVSGPRFSAVVSNMGNIGHQEDGNMMNFDGFDYMFEFSPAFVTPDVNGEGPVGFTWLHDHHDFLPEGNLVCRYYPNLGTIVCKDKFAIPGIPGRIQPLHHDLCKWWGYWTKYSLIIINPRNFPCPNWIRIYNWWKWNPPPPWLRWIFDDPVLQDPKPGYFGIVADWDVPAEASGRNLGGYDDTLGLVWQYSDSSGFENHYGGFQWIAASVDGVPESGPFGAHVLNNATQLYPFSGYNDDSLLKYMSSPGYSTEQDSSQDMNILMSFVEKLDPDTTTEIDLEYALIVSNTGEAGLRDIATKLREVEAGDANADGNVSVSDVVYLINYLFKGGPEPWLTYSDANGDEGISVSDVVYLINYLFKGGPAPVLVWYEEPPW